MTARTSIVALVPSPASVRPCLDCALAAAAGLDAMISAVHVGFNAKFVWAAPEEIALQRLRDLREASPEQRSARTRAAYDAWLERNRPSVPLTWQDDEGDVEALVAKDTGAAGLVVMRNPQHLDGRDAFHAVLFRSRRLLLVAPPEPMADRPTVGRHVVVGWKPGPQAERALRSAVAWLRKAERVSVLCVLQPGRALYIESARSALAQLGIGAEPYTLAQNGASVGRQLLTETERRGGDSLLIGAFHRGAIWDAILGGVTRDVLAHARLPVFMHS
jgi:nucleotide-binding universal stress UspA family protein